MNLSGGQRQRLAIARAIINEPEILLFDEATANMDAINASEITSSVRNIMHGKTMVVVAHHLKSSLKVFMKALVIILDHDSV